LSKITLRTELPGPKARALMAADARVIAESYTRDPDAPIVAERGEGVYIEDVDGNVFLDMAAGIAVCSTGHCHPAIVKTIQEQAARLIHLSGTDFYYRVETELAEKLVQLMPGNFPKRVFFSNSGAEAIECALKLARFKTRRPYVIAFLGAFHGRTYGALSLTASKTVQHTGFAPLLPGVIHVPYPYRYRPPFNVPPDQVGQAVLEYIETQVFGKLVDPSEVAAVFCEAIQGEGGYVEAPVDFLQGLRALTAKHGIQLVMDEVQSGIGRTGRMFAFEHAGIEPDMVCLAKGIASGLPLGATVYREDERDWGPGAHANTFGGNPLACAAALKTIALIEAGLMENAHRVGRYMMEQLQEMVADHRILGEARGRGLMLGVEIVRDKVSKEKGKAERSAIIKAAYQRGLIILGCGENTIRFSPPLVITEQEAATGLQIFEDAVRMAEG